MAGMTTCPILTAAWLVALARRPVEDELERALFRLLDQWRTSDRA